MQTFTTASSIDMAMFLNTGLQAVGAYQTAISIALFSSIIAAYILRHSNIWAKSATFLYALTACFKSIVAGSVESIYLKAYWLGMAKAKADWGLFMVLSTNTKHLLAPPPACTFHV